jgi:hypothetical protein
MHRYMNVKMDNLICTGSPTKGNSSQQKQNGGCVVHRIHYDRQLFVTKWDLILLSLGRNFAAK